MNRRSQLPIVVAVLIGVLYLIALLHAPLQSNAQDGAEGEGPGGAGNTPVPTITPHPGAPTAGPTPTPYPVYWNETPSAQFTANSETWKPPIAVNVHPLPEYRIDCPGGDTFYEGRCMIVRNQRLQYGLGGIEASLDCNAVQGFQGPMNAAEDLPALVKDGS